MIYCDVTRGRINCLIVNNDTSIMIAIKKEYICMYDKINSHGKQFPRKTIHELFFIAF
jgi:hypothetical protein